MAKRPLQLGRPAPMPASPDRATLDRVANPHPDTDYVARFTAPEFTVLCPITGQPDFAHLVIDYVPRRWLVVDMIGVAATQRGQGVGRALMAHAHEWARGQGIFEAELTVWEFNQRAIAFYEELGYTTTVRRMWKELE